VSDTMCRLYLELSQVVPEDTKTERELKLEARVAELQDDRDETRAACGRLKARVAELEEPQVGRVECPHCNMEPTVQLSRGRTNVPNASKEGGA